MLIFALLFSALFPTLFPAQFDDIDPAVKFDEISCALLGAPCYEQIASAMYGGYQKLNIEGVLK